MGHIVTDGDTIGPDESSSLGAGMAANYKYKLGIGSLVNKGSAVCAGVYIGWNAGKLFNHLTDNWVGDRIYDWF